MKAVTPSRSVSEDLLHEIFALQELGISFTDVVDRLRPRTVPPGYPYHNWNPGDQILCVPCVIFLLAVHTIIDRDESLEDKLRSILAQLEYSYEIRQWDQREVPFSVYFYVPEVHPETGQPFLEREDEAHVFKVCVVGRCFVIGGHLF